MNRIVMLIVAGGALCAGCTSTSGVLVTHSRFPYPNSDVGLYEVDNAPLQESATVFFWDEPPLVAMHDSLYRRAIAQASGTAPRSLQTPASQVSGQHVQPILINQKWVTETTVYPFFPFVATYTVHLEGTLAAMNVFDKALY